MRHYRCQCGNVLFFDNSACVQCGTQVGYDAESDQMITLGSGAAFKRCANGLDYGVCNWAVPQDGTLCAACRLNRTIPELTNPSNLDAWHKLEIAKRRVLYTLARLDLKPVSKADDPENGLAFDFLRPAPGMQVLTGHDEGVITLNVAEAEDVERERQRWICGENYRTLIGHFRHEIGHYYWDRFFKGRTDDDPCMAAFRELFGDERQDYQAALAAHYGGVTQPAVTGDKFISIYAAVHPWEDWAETWAHYLHVIDGTETAQSFGLNAAKIPIPFTPLPRDAVALPAGLQWHGEEGQFIKLLEAWAKLAPALNEIAASLGHHAVYPFIYSLEIARKFFFVHYMTRVGRMQQANLPAAA